MTESDKKGIAAKLFGGGGCCDEFEVEEINPQDSAKEAAEISGLPKAAAASCCGGPAEMPDARPTELGVLNAGETAETPKQGGGSLWVGVGSGSLALLAGISCCGLPLLSGVLATLGVSSGFLASLKPYQPYFLTVAVIALGYEFFKAYKPLASTSCCSRTSKRVLLWAVTFVMLGLFAAQTVSNADTGSTGDFSSSNSASGTNLASPACCVQPDAAIQNNEASQSCCTKPVESGE